MKLHSASGGRRRKRFSLSDRMLQLLFALLFNGPMKVSEAAEFIASYTEENEKSVRVLVYGALPKLLERGLAAKIGRKYDITLFGVHILFNRVRSRYLPFAILRALRNRYPVLYEHLDTLCFLCEHPPRDPSSEIIEYGDDYVTIKVNLRGNSVLDLLPELVLEVKLDSVLANVHKFAIPLDVSLQGLIRETCEEVGEKQRGILTLFKEDCNIRAEEELRCLINKDCPPIPLPERLIEDLLDKHGIKAGSPEAYYMFKLVDDAYYRYIAGCIEVLRTLSVDINELGLFTQLVSFREFAFQLALWASAGVVLLYNESLRNHRGAVTESLLFKVFVEHLKNKDADLGLEILIKTLRDQIAKATGEPMK